MFPDAITRTLPDPVIQQAQELSAEERQDLFLGYSVKAGEVWALKGAEGYVMLEAGQGLALPLWPHKQLIASWQKEEASAGEPVAISLKEFMELWLPGLEKNATDLVIFPVTKQDAGILMTAAELTESFQEELRSHG